MTDRIWELWVPGALAMEPLLEAGALDVFHLPFGARTCVLCRDCDRDRFLQLLPGAAARRCSRCILDRSVETVETRFGPLRRKVSRGYGCSRVKYEYEDLAALAREQDLCLGEILAELPK